MTTISTSAKGMLTVHYNRKDFFNIPTEKYRKNKDIVDIIEHINAVWREIESINITIHMLIHRIYNEEDYKNNKKEYFQMEIHTLIGMLQALGNSMYVNYFIIHKQLEKYKKIKKDEKLYNEYSKEIGKKITTIRNRIIVKRDKQNFYQNQMIAYTTDSFGMDFFLRVKDSDGKIVDLECNAIKDGYLLKEHLMKIFY